jgi:hypothetical protein
LYDILGKLNFPRVALGGYNIYRGKMSAVNKGLCASTEKGSLGLALLAVRELRVTGFEKYNV